LTSLLLYPLAIALGEFQVARLERKVEANRAG
jgi:hypothetical protein